MSVGHFTLVQIKAGSGCSERLRRQLYSRKSYGSNHITCTIRKRGWSPCTACTGPVDAKKKVSCTDGKFFDIARFLIDNSDFFSHGVSISFFFIDKIFFRLSHPLHTTKRPYLKKSPLKSGSTTLAWFDSRILAESSSQSVIYSVNVEQHSFNRKRFLEIAENISFIWFSANPEKTHISMRKLCCHSVFHDGAIPLVTF